MKRLLLTIPILITLAGCSTSGTAPVTQEQGATPAQIQAEQQAADAAYLKAHPSPVATPVGVK